MIYLATDDYRYKIGFSNNIPQRMMSLSAKLGVQVNLVAAIEGGREEEQRAHFVFEEYRLTGEWFLKEQEIEDWFAAHPQKTVDLVSESARSGKVTVPYNAAEKADLMLAAKRIGVSLPVFIRMASLQVARRQNDGKDI